MLLFLIKKFFSRDIFAIDVQIKCKVKQHNSKVHFRVVSRYKRFFQLKNRFLAVNLRTLFLRISRKWRFRDRFFFKKLRTFKFKYFNYKLALIFKQLLKFLYVCNERGFKRNLLNKFVNFSNRLDLVCIRVHFFKTILESRTCITRGFVRVNGISVSYWNYYLKKFDYVSLHLPEMLEMFKGKPYRIFKHRLFRYGWRVPLVLRFMNKYLNILNQIRFFISSFFLLFRSYFFVCARNLCYFLNIYKLGFVIFLSVSYFFEKLLRNIPRRFIFCVYFMRNFMKRKIRRIKRFNGKIRILRKNRLRLVYYLKSLNNKRRAYRKIAKVLAPTLKRHAYFDECLKNFSGTPGQHAWELKKLRLDRYKDVRLRILHYLRCISSLVLFFFMSLQFFRFKYKKRNFDLLVKALPFFFVRSSFYLYVFFETLFCNFKVILHMIRFGGLFIYFNYRSLVNNIIKLSYFSQSMMSYRNVVNAFLELDIMEHGRKLSKRLLWFYESHLNFIYEYIQLNQHYTLLEDTLDEVLEEDPLERAIAKAKAKNKTTVKLTGRLRYLMKLQRMKIEALSFDLKYTEHRIDSRDEELFSDISLPHRFLVLKSKIFNIYHTGRFLFKFRKYTQFKFFFNFLLYVRLKNTYFNFYSYFKKFNGTAMELCGSSMFGKRRRIFRCRKILRRRLFRVYSKFYKYNFGFGANVTISFFNLFLYFNCIDFDILDLNFLNLQFRKYICIFFNKLELKCNSVIGLQYFFKIDEFRSIFIYFFNIDHLFQFVYFYLKIHTSLCRPYFMSFSYKFNSLITLYHMFEMRPKFQRLLLFRISRIFYLLNKLFMFIESSCDCWSLKLKFLLFLILRVLRRVFKSFGGNLKSRVLLRRRLMQLLNYSKGVGSFDFIYNKFLICNWYLLNVKSFVGFNYSCYFFKLNMYILLKSTLVLFKFVRFFKKFSNIWGRSCSYSNWFMYFYLQLFGVYFIKNLGGRFFIQDLYLIVVSDSFYYILMSICLYLYKYLVGTLNFFFKYSTLIDYLFNDSFCFNLVINKKYYLFNKSRLTIVKRLIISSIKRRFRAKKAPLGLTHCFAVTTFDVVQPLIRKYFYRYAAKSVYKSSKYSYLFVRQYLCNYLLRYNFKFKIGNPEVLNRKYFRKLKSNFFFSKSFIYYDVEYNNLYPSFMYIGNYNSYIRRLQMRFNFFMTLILRFYIHAKSLKRG